MKLLTENRKLIFKGIEFFLLFCILPIILVLPIKVYLKLIIIGLGVLYVIFQSIKMKSSIRIIFFKKPSKNFVFRTLTISLLVFLIGISILMFFKTDLLFNVMINKPKLWGIILLVYTFLSVIPQEFIYRTFFFTRYSNLFTNDKLLFFVNAICFSLCHLFLKNFWVLVITFLGGYLFAYSYKKEQSLGLVVLEHAIYGNLIFTIGLGEMLAFPT